MVRDYAPEDDPHQPTNIPDELEERAHTLFEYTKTRSGSGATAYVKPQTEEGYPDYALMLDLMGLDVGTIFRRYDSTLVVTDRCTAYVRWGEEYEHERGSINTLEWNQSDRHPREGEPRWFGVEENRSVLRGLWEPFLYGDVEVLGHVTEVRQE
jgi:hypothetical protein